MYSIRPLGPGPTLPLLHAPCWAFFCPASLPRQCHVIEKCTTTLVFGNMATMSSSFVARECSRTAQAAAASSVQRSRDGSARLASLQSKRRRCRNIARAEGLLPNIAGEPRHAAIARSCPLRMLNADGRPRELQRRISGARRRIFIASLYIGKEERELVSSRCALQRHAADVGARRDSDLGSPRRTEAQCRFTSGHFSRLPALDSRNAQT